jgi:hypothetical protein
VFIAMLAFTGPARMAELLPDMQLTPGAADPTLTKEKLCSKSFHTGSVRDVDDRLKQAVMTAYNIQDCVLRAGKTKSPSAALCSQMYEFDHLISIEIGGAETQANIWPQRLEGILGARVKDKLEDHLHSLVCAGTMQLLAAQRCISQNWITCYQKVMHR